MCRQKGRRERSPEVLSTEDIRSLLAALDFREFVMVLLDVTTGLRLSELMGLQWQDLDFQNLRINVTRSIVKQRLGRCKTEPSLAAVPLHEQVAVVLRKWHDCALYSQPSDWVFASSEVEGKMPYWGAPIMRKKIMPIARKLGITRLRGWHTLRHTYGSLLHE